MNGEIFKLLSVYGYLAIFLLVFLQEAGFPNPFPNELLLLFSGYLTYRGLMFLPFVVITAITADLIATSLLYFLFYNTGNFILQKKPKWLPLSGRIISRLSKRISQSGLIAVIFFRLIPFTRGYTSVIAGLIQVKPGLYIPIAFITATGWAAFYVIIGNYMGPSWNLFMQNLDIVRSILPEVMVVIVVLFLILLSVRVWYGKGRINRDSITKQ